MRRAALISLFCLAWLAPDARATDQVRELIVVDGRYQKLDQFVEPLKPWLSGLPERPWRNEILSTNCWRGYMATWLLENDRLFLLAIHRQGSGKVRWVEVPLAPIFGEAHPVPADWYTGSFAVPLGSVVSRLRWNRFTIHPKTLHVEIVKGRVTKRRVHDNRTQRALVRSYDDIEWVARPKVVPPDDGNWHDARLVTTDAFRKQVPKGARFRTRGLLMVARDDKSLYIPESPLAEGAGCNLINVPDIEVGRYNSPPVEVTGTWTPGEYRITIDVTAIRKLKPGETIHHPKFPVPPDAKAKARAKMEEKAWKVRSPADAHWVTGDFVRIRGTLENGAVSSILGAEVALDASLQGKDVVAFGNLDHWYVTPYLLRTNRDVATWVGKRGPGHYYRLVDPFTGKLVTPRAAP